jgi:hypothetical protein
MLIDNFHLSNTYKDQRKLFKLCVKQYKTLCHNREYIFSTPMFKTPLFIAYVSILSDLLNTP